MTPGRALLYGACVGAFGLGVRSLTRGAVPVEVAAGAIAAFSGVITAGVLEPRLSMFAEFVHHGGPCPSAPRVALTFDDGPSLEHTPRMLDALDAAGAKATFFVIGRKLEGEGKALVRRAHEAGHAIGCHGFAHDRLFSLRSARRVRDDLRRALATLEDATGARARLFRPPILHTNPTIAAVAEELALTLVGFSARAYDGTARADAASVRTRAIAGLSDGAIVLMHDAAERDDFAPIAPEVLPDVLDALRARGLAGVTVDALLAD